MGCRLRPPSFRERNGSGAVKVIVNGSEVELDPGARVSDAIASVRRNVSTRGIAVAVNGNVVPRSSWERTGLNDADRVEILTAVAGG